MIAGGVDFGKIIDALARLNVAPGKHDPGRVGLRKFIGRWEVIHGETVVNHPAHVGVAQNGVGVFGGVTTIFPARQGRQASSGSRSAMGTNRISIRRSTLHRRL